MRKITLTLRERSYSIIIASDLFDDPNSFLPLQMGDRAMLVTSRIVASLYLNRILKTLRKAGINIDNVILSDNEKDKNLIMLNEIFTALLKKLHGRNTTLIALGGGVIGDLTGFAASSYQRGVRLIQIPTTLLSQVDSSVGGKTAINHPLGKNMIGAFYHPASVIINLDCLKTLSLRELSSGIAEVIKYSIALDKEFFFWLEENMNMLLRFDNRALEYCIYHCCKLKANIVSIDERENNLRTLLNFGHTYGHAIEVEMGYGHWLHGEAISAGMIMAAHASELLGQFTIEEKKRIRTLLKRAGLPVMGPKKMSAYDYLPHMMRDKKILGDTLGNSFRLVLPLEIGKSKVYDKVPQEIVLNSISDCQKNK